MFRMSKLRVTVDSRIRVTGPENPEIYEALGALARHSNPKHAQLKRLKIRFSRTDEPETIDMAERGPRSVSLPAGLLDKAMPVLKAHGHTPQVQYSRLEGVQMQREWSHRLELRPFQRDGLETIDANPIVLLRAPPGSGKTTLGLAAIARIGERALVIVPRTSLLEQWRERCMDELGMEKDDVGIIQGATRRVRDITIASQQTLANCVDDYATTFGVVMGDEAQTFAAATFLRVIDRLHANHRIGLTADERRSDGKDFLVRWMFGRPRHEVKRATLEDEGILEDVRIEVVPYGREAPGWWAALSPRGRASPNAQLRILEHIVNDRARTAIATGILQDEAARGNATLILSHRVEHCKAMQADLARVGIGAGLLLGGAENRREYAHTRDAIRAGRQLAAVGTYQAVGVGVDLPILAAGVCATPCANFRSSRFQWNQFRGRFARTSEGKREAVLHYIWDREVFGEGVVENLREWNRNVHIGQEANPPEAST